VDGIRVFLLRRATADKGRPRRSGNILEDPFSRSSHHSYFIQTTDVISHLLYRKEYPKGSLKKYNLDKVFELLEPILIKKASKNDPLGIVRN
jgi:hypothetical protein